MKYYYDYLIKNNYNVKYIEFNKKFNINNYKIYDPIDNIKLPNNYEIIESPNFLLTKNDYKEFNETRKGTHILFNNFYMWSKKKLNLYPNLKSLDKYNREKYIDKDIPILSKLSSIDNKYIEEAIIYVNKYFPNNYGNTNNFHYPISHKSALKWLKHFIKYKFKKFGPYQDFVKKDNVFMFHSILSSSINIGLINPIDIINIINKYKSKIPINSFEGFLRQLFWREYQRYNYIYTDFNKNYFGNKKKLNNDWYNGTTGIKPIDDFIKEGFDKAYLHHIIRLMYIGNFMNLSGISPKQGYKWFMEFSIDSYDWVMHQNVYDMVFFVTGGITMRKPYITSSNYILKMSDYKKEEWCEKWDKLYYNFLKKHIKKLLKFKYYFPSL